MPTLPPPFVADAVWKTQPCRWDDGVRSVVFTPVADPQAIGTLTVASGGTIPGSACAAFSAWLGEQVPLTVNSSESGVVWTLAAQPARMPVVAAFAATAWWLRACAAGVEPFTALGTIALAWSRTPLPAAVAWAFLPRAGLVGWTPTGAASAMVHVRLLDDPSANPGLRLALAQLGDGAMAERVAARAVWTGPRDRALEQAADDVLMATADNHPFSWSFWHLEPGMGPEDLRGMIRRVESFMDLWPRLEPLHQQVTRQGGIEEIGGGTWDRPAPAGRQPAPTTGVTTAVPNAASIAAAVGSAPHPESSAAAKTAATDAPDGKQELPPSQPADFNSAAALVSAETEPEPTMLRPSMAVVIPVAAELDQPPPTQAAAEPADVPDEPFPDLHSPSSTSASAKSEPEDEHDWAPPPPTPQQPPVVAEPLPPMSPAAAEQELPSPGAPGRFRVDLIDAGPNPGRTAELLARALRVPVEEAVAWCAAAPVCVAADIPAYEVRKIDVVVRLPSGARFVWEQLSPG